MPPIINITIYTIAMYMGFCNPSICYNSMKIIFLIIFTKIKYITQTFIVIGFIIDNIISDIRKYKLIILCIEQVMIDLNILIQRILCYQLM